jgi:hypothetical protein
MKKSYLLLLAFLAIFAFACGGGEEHDDCADSTAVTSADTAVVEEVTPVVEEPANNQNTNVRECEDFLKDYESWVDHYLDVKKKLKDSPMNPALVKEAAELAKATGKWATDWKGHVNCTGDQKYIGEYERITKKLNSVQ